MLTTKELNSWLDFEKIIAEDLLDQNQNLRTGPYFYRGHPDANWCLQTTLERYLGPDQAVHDYYFSIYRIQSHIETFTDKNWDLPSSQEYLNSLKNGGEVLTGPIINYMQYLRHFGYPSPLLDWTLSPFVAAYFAFRDVANKARSIAIYQFLVASESWEPRIGAYLSDVASIHPIGTASRQNRRHYLQQSVYTVCLKKTDKGIYYASHEDPNIIGKDEDGAPYGVPMRKYVIPASERTTALHSLGAYNINAYSLFGTEESLLEALFLQEYKSKQIEKNIFGDPPEIPTV